MSWHNKVLWTEGMFLRPHHFQQQERYLEWLVRQSTGNVVPYPWGWQQIVVDAEKLKQGKIAIERAVGIMPDGTAISIPDEDPPPTPLEIGPDFRAEEVVLVMPLSRKQLPDMSLGKSEEVLARHYGEHASIESAITEVEGEADLQLARKWCRLSGRNRNLGDYTGIGVAKVQERKPDNEIVLDRAYIPPMLNATQDPTLSAYVEEIHGLLRQRSEAIAARVAVSGSGGVAEVADFLLLQLVNRAEPVFWHFTTFSSLHPAALFEHCLALAGELSTFTKPEKRPGTYPIYKHDDLQETFKPLVEDIRKSLSLVFEQRAIQLPMQERRFGVYVSPISDRKMLEQAVFVLAVSADLPADQIQQQLPRQLKIGAAEYIRDIVNSALPGVKLSVLNVAPRQIPYHAGSCYFNLEKAGEHWKALKNSGGFAFHVGGDFPNLHMEFWAIKE